MALKWEDLERTPKGNLTAASKRAVEADRIEQDAKRHAEYERRRVYLTALEKFKLETEVFEIAAEAGDTNWETRFVTDREERLIQKAVEEAEKKWQEYRVQDLAEEAAAAITEQIERMRYRGLDGELTTIEVLEKIEHELTRENGA